MLKTYASIFDGQRDHGDKWRVSSPKNLMLDGMAAASGLLRLWLQLNRSRRELTLLSDDQLHDIGLTHAQVHEEIKKPFWVV